MINDDKIIIIIIIIIINNINKYNIFILIKKYKNLIIIKYKK